MASSPNKSLGLADPSETSQIQKRHDPCTATKPCGALSLLPAACCAFLLYSSATAIWDSNFDPSTIFFVVSSLSILGLLYLAMKEFERAVASRDLVKRDRLKMAIWFLAMLLNTLFSYRVTSVLQSPIMTAVVWGIAAATTLFGGFLLFCLPQIPAASKEPPLRPSAAATDLEGGKV